MGRMTAYDQNGRMLSDFDKSDYDFLCRYGRTPEEVMEENAKLIVKLNAEHIVRQNAEVENAKLRELCADMFKLAGEVYVPFEDADDWMARDGDIERRMRELGIEVGA